MSSLTGLAAAALMLAAPLAHSANREESLSGAASVTVLVYEYAPLSEGARTNAAEDVRRIFGAAGIQVRWVECARWGSGAWNPECAHFLGQDDLVVRLHAVRSGRHHGEALGAAWTRGFYADVFLDPIHALAEEGGADPRRVLGPVIAHELGHLILGTNRHSRSGVMRARWTRQDLEAVKQRQLRFTKEDAEMLRRGLMVRLASVPGEPCAGCAEEARAESASPQD